LATTKLTPASAANKKGTKGKKGAEGNRGEENTAEGSTKRKRGRPPKRLEKAPPNTKSVVEEFSTENIAKQAKRAKTRVVPLETTESVTKRKRRVGPYDGSPWNK
jgi:hypothetical protein